MQPTRHSADCGTAHERGTRHCPRGHVSGNRAGASDRTARRLRRGGDEPSLASVFKIDAASPTDVFGGLGNLRLGLETLVAQLDDKQRDLAVTRIAISVLRLQRKLAARPQMLGTLRSGIEAIAQQTGAIEATSSVVAARFGQLYADTLSKLQPRIV